MSVREQILAKVRANQPTDERPLPDLTSFPVRTSEVLDQFMTVLSTIGGKPVRVANYAEIETYLKENKIEFNKEADLVKLTGFLWQE